MNICVFCSSSNALEEVYLKAADELGDALAKGSHHLIYGGANVGLMEHLAKRVKQKNGSVTGIIPAKIHERKLGSKIADKLVVTNTMDGRKRMMREKSNAFIALPGGFGTLEEILEVITLKQLDYHQKPIVIVNVNGFFDNLLKQFETAYEEQFAKDYYRKLYKIVDKASEALTYIENYKADKCVDKWYKVPTK